MQRRGGGAGGRDGPGERTIVTLEDVARAAGVHYSTVSRALDPETARQVNVVTRKRVAAVAKRMGYHKDMVASGLKRGRTHTVAVVVGDLANPNVAPLLRGISSRLEAAGLMPLIVETQNDSARLERIVTLLLSRRVDAFILTAAHLGDGPKLRRIRRHGIPVVLAVQTVPGIRIPAFTNDDILGGTLAAQHLLALGHRRVAQLRGPADIYSCLQRAQGFSKTIAAAGATEVVLRSTAPMGTAEEGNRLMRQLLDSKRPMPTGIFAHHDLMALGALSAAEERGLGCPRDISMVGYNDLPNVERMVPPLTSIRLPREELGGLAAEFMVKMLSSADRPPPSRKLAPTLVVRQSTGPPRDFR
jgi:LacI family transcriptional regulator